MGDFATQAAAFATASVGADSKCSRQLRWDAASAAVSSRVSEQVGFEPHELFGCYWLGIPQRDQLFKPQSQYVDILFGPLASAPKYLKPETARHARGRSRRN